MSNITERLSFEVFGRAGSLGLIKDERSHPETGTEDSRKKSIDEKAEIAIADPNAYRAEIDKSNFL